MRRLLAPSLALLAAAAAAGALAAAPAVATESEPAEPPVYVGLMTFPAITGAAGPEEFSWRVSLGEDQKLESVDDESARVSFEDGPLVFPIRSVAAHDAEGQVVPTTLSVSGEDVITLRVHHRAGNPAAGWAAFDYPVTSGEGWEGGLLTHPVATPAAAAGTAELPTHPRASTCVVPKLKRKRAPRARRALKRRGCAVGRTWRGSSKGRRVLRQWPRPGTVLPAGARVHFKLGR